jgi:hypothetical protein
VLHSFTKKVEWLTSDIRVAVTWMIRSSQHKSWFHPKLPAITCTLIIALWWNVQAICGSLAWDQLPYCFTRIPVSGWQLCCVTSRTISQKFANSNAACSGSVLILRFLSDPMSSPFVDVAIKQCQCQTGMMSRIFYSTGTCIYSSMFLDTSVLRVSFLGL